MITSKEFFRHWDNVQDVTLRLIRQIPPESLDFRPTPESLTMREVATHIFHAEKVYAETGLKGKITLDDFNENPAPHLETVEDIYSYGKSIHDATNRFFRDMDWEDLKKNIGTPWGDMPLFHHLHSAYEHHWHHRGQLYVYLRLTGVEDPVFLYDYPGQRAPA